MLKGDGLKAKAMRGIIVLSVSNTLDGGMRFVRNIILSRILAKEDFGIMAIASTVMLGFEVFSDIGVKQGVIQNKRGDQKEYLNVAWWVQAIRGLALYLIALLLAPIICSFFRKPELLGIMRFIFIAILLKGLISPRAHVLEKECRFGWAAVLTQGSGIIGVITAIALAFVIDNVWALAIGLVTEGVIRFVLSFIIVPFIPSMRIERESAKMLLKFGSGMFGLPILTLIGNYADVIVLGRVLDEGQVGLYSLAATLAYMPADLLARVVNPVLLPIFSAKQDDKNSLQKAVFEINWVLAVISIPIVAWMISCPGEILKFVYTQEYAAAAIPFAILSARILTQPVASILASIYLAVGKPNLHRAFVFLRAAIIAIFIYPAVVFYGGIGAAAVVFIANVAAVILQLFWCRRVIDLSISRYLLSYETGFWLAIPVIAISALMKNSGTYSSMAVLTASTLVLICVLIVAAGLLLSGNKSSLFFSRAFSLKEQ